MLRKVIATVIMTIMCALLVTVVGCSSNENVEVNITPQEQSTSDTGLDGLTPLERGKVRRQILSDAQKDLSIWLEGDASHYDQAFTKSLLNEYKKQLAKLHNRGVDKVRIHSASHLEVVELTKNEASVKYTFTDKSYFIDVKTKKITTPSENKASQIEIVAGKGGGRWKIKAMIGKGEQTL